MKTKITLLFIILLLFSNSLLAQQESDKNSISIYFGSGGGGQDLLPGKHHYVGIDQSVWKFLYASTQLSYMHATNTRYFKLDDMYRNEHSYNFIAQFDANIRINIGPVTITPHAGIMGRYSDEVRYYSGSNQGTDTPLDEYIHHREESYRGLSTGWAIGMNLEFMIFDHTSFGLRSDFQEYNNSPAGLGTLTFQFRTNFKKLINELKGPHKD